jgi:hypothetical protein
MEGYGLFNPARLWRWVSILRFRKLAKKDKPWRFVQEFPEREDLVLPTRFGNILRAAERYPQTVYFMEAISMWPRIQSVAAQSHLDQVADSKANLDFWINLWFGGLLAAGSELAFSWTKKCPQFGIVAGAVLFALIAAKVAQSMAVDYGALVKATFDLYRSDLCAKLGFDLPANAENERTMWKALSQTLLYRDAAAFGDADPFRSKNKPARHEGTSQGIELPPSQGVRS